MSDLLVFLADYAIWAILLAPLLLLLKKPMSIAIKAWASGGLAWLVSGFIKDFFYYPRPYIASQQPIIIHPLLDGTFTSTHTATAFAISFLLYRYHKKLGLVLFIISGLVGLSRISLLVHTPLDIGGGIVLGYLCAWIVATYFPQGKKRA